MQDEISQLDESIQEYQDSDEENVIESSVSGRVKKINVSAGSDLSDIMVSDGALMVLSLDGKMAVSLSGVSGVSAGDSVTVTLSSVKPFKTHATTLAHAPVPQANVSPEPLSQTRIFITSLLTT